MTASLLASPSPVAGPPLLRRARRRGDNFTLLRVVACLMVIYHHSWALATLRNEPLRDRLGFTDVGTLAVYAFFAISGYLVLKSWDRDPRPLAFAAKRLLRIMPGLTLALIFGAYLIGPLMTELPSGVYLRSSEPAGYVGWNLLLFRIHYGLPGVFVHNTYPVLVDGSVWTLCYEVTLYACVPLIAWVLLRSGHRALVLVLLAAVLIPWDRLGALIPVLDLQSGYFRSGALYFLGGALLYAFRDRVPLRWQLSAPLAVVFVLSCGHPWAAWVSHVVLPYEIVYLAHLDVPVVRRWCRRRDVSYGLYLLAFPVQQSILHLHPGLGPNRLFVLTLPITFILAALSWRWVERPALGMKRLLSPRRTSAAAAPLPGFVPDRTPSLSGADG